MNKKFIATLYKKIELGENIFIFKREAVIKNAYIDLVSEFNELSYMENGKKIIIYPMESAEVIIAEDENDICYGYPITYEDLYEMYPDIKTEEELICKYLDEISEVVNIACYDEEKDKVKIQTTNGEILRKTDDTKPFEQFNLEYDSEKETCINVPVNDLSKMIDYLNKRKYKDLKNILINADNKIKEINEDLGEINFSLFGIDILNQIKEVKEEKEDNEDIELDMLLQELNDLIGLENIKQEINKLVKYLEFRKKVEEDLNLEKPNLHMFFTGNPGTGKTTVARIIAKLLYKMGYVKSKKVAEITPRDLIAGYVGQTAIKTSKFIENNKGGVIFIDEAYVFSADAQEFAEEALVEIIKELEKKETVFIFAGYKDEMENFMNLNPGLTSRIGYYLDYKDYTNEQLLEIFNYKTKEMGFKIEEDLEEQINELISKQKNIKNFGNGRYIDKLINKIILEHSINTENIDDKESLLTLTKDDLTEDVKQSLIFKKKVKEIGFK